MTKILFEFLTTTGIPLALANAEVRLTRSDYDETITGVLMPRLVKQVTDDRGQFLLSLMPCDTLYHVTVYDPKSDIGIHYEFYVPTIEDPEAIVRFQDLIVKDSDYLSTVPYDQTALLAILRAKAEAVAAAIRAELVATQANLNAAIYSATAPTGQVPGKQWINTDTLKHYYYVVENNIGFWVEMFASEVVDNNENTGGGGGGTSDLELGTDDPLPLGTKAEAGSSLFASHQDHVHSLPDLATITTAGLMSAADKIKLATLSAGGSESGGGTGVGTGLKELVTLVPNSNNEILLDGNVSNNFFVVLAANTKVLNPVNYLPGDEITVIYLQDTVGARLLSHDVLFGLPGGQDIILSITPSVYDIIQYKCATDGNTLIYIARPDIGAYTKVTPIARIGTVMYYMLGGAAAQGAFNKVLPGQTIYIIRNGVGPEATASIVGSTVAGASPQYVIAGAPVPGTGLRPTLTMLPSTRPAYGKAVLNFESNQTTEVRDLIIKGARNADGDARGIAPNSPATQHITIRNVDIIDCNNGVLWGNETFYGDVTMIDGLLDANGVGIDGVGSAGTTKGYTHNVYAGHNDAIFTMLRYTVRNSVNGHNVKSRAGTTILNQVWAYNSKQGRELNLPVGGKLYATNCIFNKYNGTDQGNMIGIGEETIDTARVREYVFTNCLFQHDGIAAGADMTFIINFDPTVPMRFVDCQFAGPVASTLNGDPNNNSQFAGMITKNGIRYYPAVPPVFQLTGGPIGPILPVGKPENVPMTAVV